MSKSNNGQDKEEEIIKLEEKMLELKKENRALKLQLTDTKQPNLDTNDKDKEELATLQKNNEEKELQISALSNKVQELDQKIIATIQSNNEEKQRLIEKHTEDVAQLREELEKKNNELKTLHEKGQETKGSNDNGEMIRSIMNEFYKKLYKSVEEKQTLTSTEILKLTAEIIRKETKAALSSN